MPRSSYHGHYRSQPSLGVETYSAAPAIGLAGDIYVGAQKLVESDTAFSAEGRALIFDKTAGVAARFTQFRERQPDMSLQKLDLWSVAATVRVRASARLEVAPELGVGGLTYRGYGMPPLTEIGIAGGVALRYSIANSTALIGVARFYGLSNAGSALEGRVGIAVGPLQLSYRSVSFYEAGPPLEGPEVGLRLAF